MYVIYKNSKSITISVEREGFGFDLAMGLVITLIITSIFGLVFEETKEIHFLGTTILTSYVYSIIIATSLLGLLIIYITSSRILSKKNKFLHFALESFVYISSILILTLLFMALKDIDSISCSLYCIVAFCGLILLLMLFFNDNINKHLNEKS